MESKVRIIFLVLFFGFIGCSDATRGNPLQNQSQEALDDVDTLYPLLSKYQKELELNPENPKLYFSIGKIFYLMQEYELAINYLDKSLDLNIHQKDVISLRFETFKKQTNENLRLLEIGFRLSKESGEYKHYKPLSENHLHKQAREYLENLAKKRMNSWQEDAKNKIPEAMILYGICLEKGVNGPQNQEEAFQWYEKCALAGNTDGMNKVAECFLNGKGVQKDIHEGISWYQKAADSGDTNAMYKLALHYEFKDTGRFGDEESKYLDLSINLYSKAVDKGDTNAMCGLGRCYLNGKGIDKDEEKAMQFFLRAANSGNPKAMCEIGLCYSWGKGVTKDNENMIKWFLKAAELGNAEGMFWIGFNCLLSPGYTVPVLEKIGKQTEAVYWFTKAAELDHRISMEELGRCYENGSGGCQKDFSKALYWYRLAGNMDSVKRIESLIENN